MNEQEKKINEVKKEILDQLKHLSEDFLEHKIDQDRQHKETLEKIKCLEEKTEPLIEWFKNINFFKSGIMWLLGLAAAIVGLIIAFKNLLK